MLELLIFREKASKRETKLNQFLLFIQMVWAQLGVGVSLPAVDAVDVVETIPPRSQPISFADITPFCLGSIDSVHRSLWMDGQSCALSGGWDETPSCHSLPSRARRAHPPATDVTLWRCSQVVWKTLFGKQADLLEKDGDLNDT